MERYFNRQGVQIPHQPQRSMRSARAADSVGRGGRGAAQRTWKWSTRWHCPIRAACRSPGARREPASLRLTSSLAEASAPFSGRAGSAACAKRRARDRHGPINLLACPLRVQVRGSELVQGITSGGRRPLAATAADRQRPGSASFAAFTASCAARSVMVVAIWVAA